MSDFEKINCAKPAGYKSPRPFDSGPALEEFYRTLDQNRTLREQCAAQCGDHYVEGLDRDIYIQMESAAMALRASLLYQEATPEMQREIQHITEDLINGVDPEHYKILESAIVSGGAVGAIGLTPIALGAGLAEGLTTFTEILAGLSLVAIASLVAGYGSYVYMDSSTHSDSIRLRMYDYPPIECDGVDFGKNVALDQQCFGLTRFDSCGGRRCSDYKY